MNNRDEFSELELFAKVHALHRTRLDKARQKADENAARTDSDSSDSNTTLRARFQDRPDAFSWRRTAEKAFVLTVQTTVWAYLAIAISLWLLLHVGDERWWLFTLLLFGPRWLTLLPIVALVPLAVVLRARLLLPLTAASLIVAFAATGLCVPWPWQGGTADRETTQFVSLATCNVQNQNQQWARVRALLATDAPDVLALQQAGSGMLIAIPKQMHRFMQGQLVIASRYSLRETSFCASADQTTDVRAVDDRGDAPRVIAVYALVDTPTGSLGVCNVRFSSLKRPLHDYFEQLQAGDTSGNDALRAVIEQQDRESQTVTNWIAQLPQVDVIVGGFNMPVEATPYQRHWNKYENAFSHVGLGWGFTQTASTYRVSYGLRTDHILLGDDWKPLSCHVGSPIGTNHRTLRAQIQLRR